MLRRKLTILAVVVPAVAGASIPLNAASAAPAEPSAMKVTQAPLVATRIDQTIANRNGYRVIVKNGRPESVKVADHPIRQDPIITPLDAPVVPGDCGFSFLYFASPAPRRGLVHTGFDLTTIPPAVQWQWTVAVTDNAGVGSRTWRGVGLQWNWDTTWDTVHSVGGYAVAQVSGGYAIRADGVVCVAGHPWHHAYL